MRKGIAIIVTGVLSAMLSTSVFAVDLSSKEVVKQVQEALNEAGYDCGTPDGVAGAKTNEAVAAYRAANGMAEGAGIDDDLYQVLVGGGDQNQTEADTGEMGTNSVNDDECVEKVLLHYADSIAKQPYSQVKAYLDDIGYAYETTIGGDDLATFHIPCSKGTMYIGFFPLGDDESAYGDPEREILCALEYSAGDKWITISDNLHLNGTTLSTGNKSRATVNQDVGNLKELIDFYNSEIGGAVVLGETVTVSTDADREKDVKGTITSHAASTYTKTTVDRVEVNSNVGTSAPDDFIILIYLTWDQKNGVDMTRTMLEMYSDDMAATLADKYNEASEIVLFWDVPYLLENGTCAKYSYSGQGGKAYKVDKVGPLYN